MLTAIRKRLSHDEEQGFTLIELMVVVLIIAILIAIAIPTFLGARARSQNRAAQSDLRNALAAEKTVYTDTEQYSADVADGGVLKQNEPSIKWVTTAPTKGQVQVQLGSTAAPVVANGVVCLTTVSSAGTTWSIKDIAVGTNAGTWYSKAAVGTCDSSSTGMTKDGFPN